MAVALAVGGLGAPKRGLQVRGGHVTRLTGVDPSGAPGRYLLGYVCVAVGIGEGEERSVAGALGVCTRLACLDRERRAVPDVTNLNTAADERLTCRLDVGDD